MNTVLHVLWAVVQITLSALIGLTAGCLLVAGLFYFNLTPY